MYSQLITSVRKNKIIYLFFIVYLGIHIFLGYNSHLLSDKASDYEITVQNLLKGNGFVLPNGEIANRYPPVFPLLLATLSVFSFLTRLPLQVIVSLFLIFFTALSAIVIKKMVLLFSNSERTLNIMLILYFFSPYTLYLTFSPLSEVPFSFFFYLSLYFFLGYTRRPYFSKIILVGILLGVCMLIRPIALFFPLIFILFLVVLKSPFKTKLYSSLVLISSTALILLPWELFNYSKTGKIVVLSTGGVPSVRDGFSFNNKNFREKIILNENVENFSNSFFQNYSVMNSYKDILNFISVSWKENKQWVIDTYFLKIKRSWYGTDSQNSRLENFNFVFSSFVLFSFLLSLFFIQVKDGNVLKYMTVVFILYFWLMTAIVLSIVRYMTPVFPLMYIFIAFFIDFILNRYSIRKRTVNIN